MSEDGEVARGRGEGRGGRGCGGSCGASRHLGRQASDLFGAGRRSATSRAMGRGGGGASEADRTAKGGAETTWGRDGGGTRSRTAAVLSWKARTMSATPPFVCSLQTPALGYHYSYLRAHNPTYPPYLLLLIPRGPSSSSVEPVCSSSVVAQTVVGICASSSHQRRSGRVWRRGKTHVAPLLSSAGRGLRARVTRINAIFFCCRLLSPSTRARTRSIECDSLVLSLQRPH